MFELFINCASMELPEVNDLGAGGLVGNAHMGNELVKYPQLYLLYHKTKEMMH